MSESIEVQGKALTVNRGVFRLCRLRDEYYQFVENPAEFLVTLKKDRRANADLFTFIQEIPDRTPRFDFPLEWDSAAVVPLTTFDHWWNKQINAKTRNMVRKAQKCGVEIRLAEFNDELLLGIQRIYNESPLRQGRRFWHYNKDLETIRREHATFFEQSQFVGAYHQGHLIGFIKLVHGRGVSSLMNIISMISHRDKAPTNALIGKAVEICTERQVPLLQYGTGNSRTIGDFKKHHAFEEFRVPRYFVPLTLTGATVLKLGLHRRLDQRLPENWRDKMLAVRGRWNAFRFRKVNQVGAVAQPAEQRV